MFWFKHGYLAVGTGLEPVRAFTRRFSRPVPCHSAQPTMARHSVASAKDGGGGRDSPGIRRVPRVCGANPR